MTTTTMTLNTSKVSYQVHLIIQMTNWLEQQCTVKLKNGAGTKWTLISTKSPICWAHSTWDAADRINLRYFARRCKEFKKSPAAWCRKINVLKNLRTWAMTNSVNCSARYISFKPKSLQNSSLEISLPKSNGRLCSERVKHANHALGYQRLHNKIKSAWALPFLERCVTLLCKLQLKTKCRDFDFVPPPFSDNCSLRSFDHTLSRSLA